MQTTGKLGDPMLARRIAALTALRSDPRATDLELKPAPTHESTAQAFTRSAHTARSTAVHPGAMSWHELHSPEPERSARFLAALLGDEVIADHRSTTLLCDGLHVAGVQASEPGRAASWTSFVRVPNVDVLCDIALACGGSVRIDPTGIVGLDRRAVIADPTGAALTIIAGGDDRRTIGAGAIGWDELRSDEPAESVRFWCAVFGWSAAPIAGARASNGVVFLNGGRAVASMQRADERDDRRGPRSRWLPVATVRGDLFDATVHRAIRDGARIGVAPAPHGVLGKHAVLVDPSGLEIALGAEPVAQFAAA